MSLFSGLWGDGEEASLIFVMHGGSVKILGDVKKFQNESGLF